MALAQQLGLREQSTDDHQFQDPYNEQEGEEDTLSLCDLPLTSSSDSSWDECFSNKDDQNSSFGDEGFFEFFSEDFTASTYPSADKIIFCGKVIGSKEEEETTVMDREEAQGHEFRAKIKGGWFHKLRTTSSRHQIRRTTTQKTFSSQGSIKKVSVMSSPLVKSKWYVFAFGMGRYSMEMEQKDIKMRQSRKAPATMFQIIEKGEAIKGNGLWGLLKLLGCKKNQKTQ
ncbi:hypothetical protein HS088_TW21G01683 [Tripterygium wilfordii]|uniref:Uncharacterized protein n=1 Tax=Tripterygium wilfordii TaxID=458696 RepID=A0A7J7C6Y0_TRIWF|nr:uncharacterized protein LOC119988046 [Tripterygium wilfordii]KAF5729516.1 hypothetical protein HS088_TW21G01683 [Tripterygium wilfordii]